MPWYADLELERHGAHYIEPELNVALLTSDGGVLAWWTDIERTVGRSSSSAARTPRRCAAGSTSSCRSCRHSGAEAKSPPLPPDERRRLLERSAAGRRLLEVSALSPLEFVQQEFEHPTVRAGLLFFNGLREVDLRVRGFGHHIAALLASPAKAQMSRGGTGGACARAGGGGARDRRRIPPDDRAEAHRRGRRPRDRRRDHRRRVHPARGTSSPPRSIRTRPFSICSIERSCRANPRPGRSASNTTSSRRCSRSISICASRRATPRARSTPELAHALMVIMGLDHFDQFGDIVRHHEDGTDPADGDVGRLSDAVRPEPGAARPPHRLHVGEAALSPAGRSGQLVPGARRATAATMLTLWRRHAPNLADAVID